MNPVLQIKLLKLYSQSSLTEHAQAEVSGSLLSKRYERLTVETSLLSPLIKSILTAREPASLKHRGRAAVMHRIEQRLRFLAVGLQPPPVERKCYNSSHAHLLSVTYRQTLLLHCEGTIPATGRCC